VTFDDLVRHQVKVSIEISELFDMGLDSWLIETEFDARSYASIPFPTVDGVRVSLDVVLEETKRFYTSYVQRGLIISLHLGD
jgi:hypothetical protein